MKGICVVGLAVLTGSLLSASASGQAPGAGDQPAVEMLPIPPDSAPAGRAASPRVRPLMEGPLHEAFLSPRKDRDPSSRESAAASAVGTAGDRPAERDMPNGSKATGSGTPSRKDFVWVTGTWRVPPPGRFWVNGYWKRDDKGWYRVPGFWSERKTDRLDYRKNGPPQERPDDEPGEPPSADCFFIPGQYYPDGDGVAWKKGFWAKVQPGWSWVPAQWVRQPDGWVFQDGYWDRTLEDRGTLFAPAEVDRRARGRRPDVSAVHQGPAGDLRPAERRIRPAELQLRRLPGRLLRRHRPLLRLRVLRLLERLLRLSRLSVLRRHGYPYYATPVQYGIGGATVTATRRVRLRLWAATAACWGARSGFGMGYRLRRLWLRLRRLWRLRLSVLRRYGGLGYGGFGYGGYGGFGYGGFGGFGYGGFGGFGLGFGFGFPGFGFGFGFGYPFFGSASASAASADSLLGPWRLGWAGAAGAGAIASRSPTATCRSTGA